MTRIRSALSDFTHVTGKSILTGATTSAVWKILCLAVEKTGPVVADSIFAAAAGVAFVAVANACVSVPIGGAVGRAVKMHARRLVAEVTCPAGFAVALEIVEVSGSIERDAFSVCAWIGKTWVDRTSSNRLDVHSIAALEHVRVVDFVVAAALSGHLRKWESLWVLAAAAVNWECRRIWRLAHWSVVLVNNLVRIVIRSFAHHLRDELQIAETRFHLARVSI